jgi:hypothetical protein
MTKAAIIRKLSAKESIRVIAPNSHKFYNVIRKAEKVQTNAIRFEGGSWVYFNDIDCEVLNGFKLKPLGDIPPVVYEWVS